mgnify:CR=1 FL=1
MKKIKFKITVNPFDKTIEIVSVLNGNKEILSTTFEEFDEWQGFEMHWLEFDFHIHYDEDLTVSIYEVENGVGLYDDSFPVNLYLQLNSVLINKIKTTKLYWHEKNNRKN